MAELEGKPEPKHWNPPSTMETQADLANRGVKWWNTSILQYISSLPPSPTPHHILVVSHAGFIRVLMRTLVGSRKVSSKDTVKNWELKNCSVVEIDVGSDRKGTLVRYGDVSHFFQLENTLERNADDIEG
jgi:2,3-bisphosphoglycerate-dependent phosphoglycerate mutase